MNYPKISLLLAFTVALLTAFAQGQTWTQDGPADRYHASGIYDVTTDQMVVFGGENASLAPMNDVWSTSGIVSAGQTITTTPYKWVQVFPTGTAPAARFGHGSAYDSSSNRMIIFAGGTSSTACLNDAWVMEDANSTLGTPSWVQLATSGTLPTARMNHVTQYDPSTNSLIVFGGNNCAGGYLSDVWVLSNADGSVGTPTWTHVIPTGTAPPVRTGQSSVYDSTNNRMMVFGGVNSLTAATQFYGDTWILTTANGIGGTPSWISEKVTGTAPQLRFHNAFYNAPNNDMVVFGGLNQIAPAPQSSRVFILLVANGL